jgi:hypothetical protein
MAANSDVRAASPATARDNSGRLRGSAASLKGHQCLERLVLAQVSMSSDLGAANSAVGLVHIAGLNSVDQG